MSQSMFILLYSGDNLLPDAVSSNPDTLKEQAVQLNDEDPIDWKEKDDNKGWIGYVGNLDIHGESEYFYLIEPIKVI